MKQTLSTLIFVTAAITAIAEAPEWFDTLPQLYHQPHNAEELLGIHTKTLPIDTANKYIEQTVNYNRGSLTYRFEGGDSLHTYEAYGIYETDSTTLLYYKVTYGQHIEIRVALNPFTTRYPSTLRLYWHESNGDSLPSMRFNCTDGEFTVISRVQPGDSIRQVTETYDVDLSNNRFRRLTYSTVLFDIECQ